MMGEVYPVLAMGEKWTSVSVLCVVAAMQEGWAVIFLCVEAVRHTFPKCINA